MNRQHQTQQMQDYDRVAQSIHYLSGHVHEQPSLDEMAAHVHLSKYHFQRLFKRWAGITPTQFLQYLTVEYAKERLLQADSIFNASLDVGLSGAGRLHDHFINIEAMTPGQYKAQGEGLNISYGFHPTSFGLCLLAATERGICALRFVEANGFHIQEPVDETLGGLRSDHETLSEISAEWPAATLREDPSVTQPLVDRIFATESTKRNEPFHLQVKGTNFQVNVWEALLTIPAGSLVTYQSVAERMGQPKAVRAVASAVAKNPIGYLIPCHRVIAKAGQIHRYRWGDVRKKAIVGWEAAQESQEMLAL